MLLVLAILKSLSICERFQSFIMPSQRKLAKMQVKNKYAVVPGTKSRLFVIEDGEKVELLVGDPRVPEVLKKLKSRKSQNQRGRQQQGSGERKFQKGNKPRARNPTDTRPDQDEKVSACCKMSESSTFHEGLKGLSIHPEALKISTGKSGKHVYWNVNIGKATTAHQKVAECVGNQLPSFREEFQTVQTPDGHQVELGQTSSFGRLTESQLFHFFANILPLMLPAQEGYEVPEGMPEGLTEKFGRVFGYQPGQKLTPNVTPDFLMECLRWGSSFGVMDTSNSMEVLSQVFATILSGIDIILKFKVVNPVNDALKQWEATKQLAELNPTEAELAHLINFRQERTKSNLVDLVKANKGTRRHERLAALYQKRHEMGEDKFRADMKTLNPTQEEKDYVNGLRNKIGKVPATMNADRLTQINQLLRDAWMKPENCNQVALEERLKTQERVLDAYQVIIESNPKLVDAVCKLLSLSQDSSALFEEREAIKEKMQIKRVPRSQLVALYDQWEAEDNANAEALAEENGVATPRELETYLTGVFNGDAQKANAILNKMRQIPRLAQSKPRKLRYDGKGAEGNEDIFAIARGYKKALEAIENLTYMAANPSYFPTCEEHFQQEADDEVYSDAEEDTEVEQDRDAFLAQVQETA